VEQRISVITLGADDVAASVAFYRALGWAPVAGESTDVYFFSAGGLVVALWGRGQLAEDSCVSDNGGWGGITLAHNVRSPAEVDAALSQAREAGARIGREGAATFWGGYSGVFLDPDGHPWEIAYNPGWALAEDGSVQLSP